MATAKAQRLAEAQGVMADERGAAWGGSAPCPLSGRARCEPRGTIRGLQL